MLNHILDVELPSKIKYMLYLKIHNEHYKNIIRIQIIGNI